MMRIESLMMKHPTRVDLPVLGRRGTFSYVVGDMEYELVSQPKKVFPPSETTLALAEVLQRVKAKRSLDVGSGSGLLAIVLGKGECKNVVAIDCNPRAVAVTYENVRRIGLEGVVRCEKVDFLDWTPSERFDLAVSNPPFMPMPDNSHFISEEIMTAIRGGVDGTDLILAFARAASLVLDRGGRYIFGLPNFADSNKVMRELEKLYIIRVMKTSLVRYWLAEHSQEFRDHILQLSNSGHCEIVSNGEVLRTTLSVVECRLRV